MRMSLEPQSETELHGAVLARRLLQILRTALLGRDGPVRPIEHIEGLRHQVEPNGTGQRNTLLEAQTGAVTGRLRECVTGHDGAVRTKPGSLGPSGAQDAQIAAMRGLRTLADARVMDAAHLESTTNLPDPVETIRCR